MRSQEQVNWAKSMLMLALTCPALFVPSDLIEIGLEGSLDMRKKRATPEQIVLLLRQIEVSTSQGKSIAIGCQNPLH